MPCTVLGNELALVTVCRIVYYLYVSLGPSPPPPRTPGSRRGSCASDVAVFSAPQEGGHGLGPQYLLKGCAGRLQSGTRKEEHAGVCQWGRLPAPCHRSPQSVFPEEKSQTSCGPTEKSNNPERFVSVEMIFVAHPVGQRQLPRDGLRV